MKTSILLSLILGLALVGCNRAQTDSGKASASNASDPNRPIYDDKAVAAGTSNTPGTSNTTGTPSTNDRTTGEANADRNAPTIVPLAPATGSGEQTAGLTPPSPGRPNGDPTLPDRSQRGMNPTMPRTGQASNAGGDTNTTVAGRITEWNLTADGIGSEFQRTGRIERSKPAGAGEPTGPMDDVLVTSINSKLRSDSDLSDQKFDVTVERGVATLTGTARSLDQIGRAIAITLDTAGVNQANSMIKLESSR